MIRLLIKLGAAALVLYAAWNVGVVYSRYYRFQDALQQTAQFSDRRTNRAVCDSAIEEAGRLEVPVEPEAIIVRRGMQPSFNCGRNGVAGPGASAAHASKLTIEAEYSEEISVLPGYRRIFDFRPTATAVIRP
jgi:hypothetical protein